MLVVDLGPGISQSQQLLSQFTGEGAHVAFDQNLSRHKGKGKGTIEEESLESSRAYEDVSQELGNYDYMPFGWGFMG
ncbi:hypothetical protein ACLOJK_040541 [Asimina triloba]